MKNHIWKVEDYKRNKYLKFLSLQIYYFHLFDRRLNASHKERHFLVEVLFFIIHLWISKSYQRYASFWQPLTSSRSFAAVVFIFFYGKLYAKPLVKDSIPTVGLAHQRFLSLEAVIICASIRRLIPLDATQPRDHDVAYKKIRYT